MTAATLAHDLHVLVALMDRRADGLLARAHVPVSYRRFLLLVHVGKAAQAGEPATQRELAHRLGGSEAAMSRLVAGMARDGLLNVASGGGNRRRVGLTPRGADVLAAGEAALGDAFERLVDARGVDADALSGVLATLVEGLRDAESDDTERHGAHLRGA